MRIPRVASSRSAYLFVTINLVLLLVFLVSGSSNLRTVQRTLAEYDTMLRGWFTLRIAITDPRTAGGDLLHELPAYQQFQSLMTATGSSTIIWAAARLSDELDASVRRSSAAWRVLDASLTGTVDNAIDPADTQQTLEAMANIDQVQAALFQSRELLESFVHTQERALSVLLLCLGGTIILIVVVFAVVEAENDRTRRDAARTQLLAKNSMETQETERARIAHGLHDSLAQELSLATMETDLIAASVRASGEDAEQAYERLKTRLRGAIDWIRNLAYDLRPPEIDEGGLAVAIVTFCEERAAEHQLTFTWHVNQEIGTLPTDRAINIYRIAQEAVTNALRHSGADRLTLNLQSTGQHVELTVSDNGIGMVRSGEITNGTRSGLGIAGMEERAQMLNAEFSIDSGRGRGTSVRLSVPITRRGSA